VTQIKGHSGEVIGPDLDLVDLHGAAKIMGIGYTTARIYNSDGKLPNPQARRGGSPLWDRLPFTAWAIARAQRMTDNPKGRPPAQVNP
jgi:hypothetical protein